MKLYIKNIGKIAETSVEIKGITVIAGENDTGKSTVGKALFSIFNSFYEVQEQVRQERITSVTGTLYSIYRKFPIYGQIMSEDSREVALNIVNKAKYYLENSRILEDELYKILDSHPEKIESKIKKSDIEDTANQILEILQISDIDIFQSVINNKMKSEFSGQILNIYSQGKGEIILQIRDKEFGVKILEDSVSINDMSCNIYTEAIYLDDPFVMDELDYKIHANRQNYNNPNHRIHLEDKLLVGWENASVIEEIIAEKKFIKIYNKLTSVCEGDVVGLKNRRGIGYQVANSDKALNIKNLSTGLKTFAILKTLLTNGTIKYHGTIILDEPEIHLHPEWQLLFAEIIVLLHKEFGMHILLNTHSPYFLRAIEVYSAKYEVSNMCKYYLSEVKAGGEAYINDVTNDINKIYEKLSIPLQQLEDERWGD